MITAIKRLCMVPFLLCAVAATPDSLLPQTIDSRTLLDQLTLEEKASLITGRNWWETYAVSRLGIPSVWMADGPVGLRKVIEDSTVPATCFPSSGAMAATWNLELIAQVGSAIGAEARSHDVTLVLGPGLNMKRHPRAGRNFEYYSEDPLLSGRTAAAFVRGVQSRGVGATIKHFAVNNQEHRRMLIDARVPERALREIYLRGFEIAVREGAPQAVMTAYNKVNGTYATQHPQLLNEILRGEWGFGGLVVSDWGSMDEPIASFAAGLDLEMPGNPLTSTAVVRAVREGRLAETDLDRAVLNVLQLVDRHSQLSAPRPEDMIHRNHDLAHAVAVESMVLLKNDGILPLGSDPAFRIGVLGRLAHFPRIQGVGSSRVNPVQVDTAWASILELGVRQGHRVRAWTGDIPEFGATASDSSELLRFLGNQDVVVIFAGQEESHDAEAWDRPSSRLSDDDLRLISATSTTGVPFVVVLVGGGSMDVSGFESAANAMLMGWLGGEAFGAAVADVLFGMANPSGKLSETFAWSTADHPSDINFPGGPWHVEYGEGLYVGYRYFQTFDRDVAYPFGHGLSYTTFEYLEANAPDTVEAVDEGLNVTVRVANTGHRTGAETVQIYLRHLNPTVDRPDRELIGFRKLEIGAGDTTEYSFHIEPQRFAYFNDWHGRWVIEPGGYQLLVGSSATDIRIVLPLFLRAGTVPLEPFTLYHTLGEIHEDDQGRVIVDFLTTMWGRPRLSEAGEHDFDAAIVRELPLKKVANFSEGALPVQVLQRLLDLVNSDMPPDQVLEALGDLRGNATPP